MRVWMIVGVLCLAGCGAYVPMAELEHQAALTGDWSAVEKRERIMARREQRKGPSCAAGLVAYCESRLGGQSCACIDRDHLTEIFAGRN